MIPSPRQNTPVMGVATESAYSPEDAAPLASMQVSKSGRVSASAPLDWLSGLFRNLIAAAGIVLGHDYFVAGPDRDLAAEDRKMAAQERKAAADWRAEQDRIYQEHLITHQDEESRIKDLEDQIVPSKAHTPPRLTINWKRRRMARTQFSANPATPNSAK